MMEMWGIIQIASLVLLVILVVFMWRADAKINRLQDRLDKEKDR